MTRFVYDAIGQLVESYDPEGFSTSYAYDLLGRLTYRNHPDAGKCKYLYDPAGNLIQESNMLGDINYDYTYYRLLKKRYSYMTGNDVTYSYRNSGRGAGLPRRITDGSGTMSLEYDAMGRVARSVRMLSVPASAHVYTFTHSYVYDSWNRMIQMTYPDGERVEYHYHPDGTLAGMTGDKGGNLREYISSAEYDKYGKRTKVVYGNGTCAEYSYDSLQRLSVLRSNDGHQHIMQKINYLYDKVGNITMLHNSAGSVDGLGGAYTNTYIYDPLNRLVNASGSGSAEGQQRNFTIDQIAYSPSGRLGVKAQNWDSGTSQGEVVQEYGYSQTDVRPHAPEFIKNQAGDNAIHSLTWDEAGNLVRLSEQRPQGSTYGTRFLGWTVDNRLVTVADWRHYSYYAYDHTGERTLKMTGAVSSGDMNASVQHSVSCLDDITLYPSPFLVVTGHGYTKHYYAGAERVAARLGAGGLNHDSVCVGNNMDAEQTADSLFLEATELANKMEYRRPTTSGIVQIDGSAIGGLEYFNPDDVPVSMQAEVTINPNRIHETIGTLSPSGQPAHNSEPEVYFYHSDHLGSASWITGSNGKPIQHLQYLPFGEPFVDQRTGNYSERFRFTGKEKDEETGYGYFGARYMDHELMTMWLSVDPMADKYPSISPYAFCAWNPVKLIDPDGREINPVFGTDGVYKGCTTEGYTGTIIIYDGNDDFSALTAEELIETTNNCEKAASYYSREVSKKMTAQAKKEMYTHIIGIADGTPIGESVFCSEDMTLIYNSNGNGNWNTRMVDVGKDYFILTATDKYIFGQGIEDGAPCFQGSYEATVENILSTVVNHEWYGHFINKYTGADHYKCYEASKESPYYSKTTERYKEFIEQRIVHFKNK